MPYELNDYWNDLDSAIIKFDKNNHALLKVISDNKEDENSYKIQREALFNLKKLWVKLDRAVSPAKKIAYGDKMDSLPSENFGPEQIPFIKGPKSLAFAEQVYLPHLQKFQGVKFSRIVLELSKMMSVDLEARKIHSLVKAVALKKRIENYIMATKQGIFADASIKILTEPEDSVKKMLVL